MEELVGALLAAGVCWVGVQCLAAASRPGDPGWTMGYGLFAAVFFALGAALLYWTWRGNGKRNRDD